MTALPSPKKKLPRPHVAFSTVSSLLAMVAVASSLVFVHDWGKGAIPVIQWVCGTSAALLLASIIVDSRRP